MPLKVLLLFCRWSTTTATAAPESRCPGGAPFLHFDSSGNASTAHRLDALPIDVPHTDFRLPSALLSTKVYLLVMTKLSYCYYVVLMWFVLPYAKVSWKSMMNNLVCCSARRQLIRQAQQSSFHSNWFNWLNVIYMLLLFSFLNKLLYCVFYLTTNDDAHHLYKWILFWVF